MRIHFHGNCQAPALRDLLLELRPDWQVTATEVHFVDPADRGRCETEIATADIVIVQPVAKGYRGLDWLSSDAVLATARPGATRVVFPVMYFSGQHPELRSYRRGDGSQVAGPYGIYHNSSLILMALLGMQPERAATMLASSLLLPEEFVRRRYDQSLSELLQRQAAAKADLDIASLIAAHGSAHILFNIFNHPTRALFSMTLERLSDLVGLGLSALPPGKEPLPAPTLPVLPCVTRAIGLRPSRDGLDCFWSASWTPFPEYVARCVAFYSHPAHKAELAALFFSDPWSVEVALSVMDMTRQEHASRAAGALVTGIFDVFLGRPPSSLELHRDVGRAADLHHGAALVDGFARCGEFRNRRPAFAARYLD